MNKKCEQLIAKGNECLDNNYLEDALSYFNKIVKYYPKNEVITQIHKVRMFILERLNRLDEAFKLCNHFKSNSDTGIQRVRAIVLKRVGNYSESLDLAIKLLQRNDLDQKSNQELHFLIADIYNKQNKPDKAIEFYNKANDIIRKSPENSEFDKNYVLNFIDLMKVSFRDINNSNLTVNKYKTPVFLVGFPRSGTTLLNSILNAHSDINTIDEQSTFNINQKVIVQDKENSIDYFTNLNEEETNQLRETYWNETSKFVEDNKIIVDKLPLRFLSIGILYKIFPDAKYIFMVRHPLDCILSCFMQNFAINDHMANFYTLGESSEFYKKSMNLFQEYYNDLYLNVHFVYYENLINNFQEELNELMEFLNLDFDKNMYEYNTQIQTAFTPSYSQITEKPYQTAMNRYKYYKNHIQDIVNKVKPFIDWFGYQY